MTWHLGLRRIHWLVVVCCLLGSNALGQQAGQIVGVVTDSSGGVVPGITIKANEVGTGFQPVDRDRRGWPLRVSHAASHALRNIG